MAFAVHEIVEIAVQIEINGRDFYNTLSGKTKDKRIKEIFEHLAEEEEEHMKKFREILSTFHKYESKEAYPEEYFSYLNSLASDVIFTQKDKGSELAKKMESRHEAVDFGVKAEKDSILFYEGIKKVTPQSEHPTVNEVITEEQNHLTQLIGLRKYMQKGKEAGEWIKK